MKLTLMIEGSAEALARALAALQAEGPVMIATEHDVTALPMGAAAPTLQSTVNDMTATGAETDDDDGAPNADAPEVDATGLPWDERIHASTKGVNADGSWKSRRGGPKGAELDAIVTELRARTAMPAPIEQPAPMAMPAMTAPAAMTMPAPMAAPTDTTPGINNLYPVEQQPAPMMAPVPMPTPQPAAAMPPMAAPAPEQPAATGALTFPEFMAQLSEKMKGETPLITNDYLIDFCKRFAAWKDITFDAITALSTLPELIPVVVEQMRVEGHW